MEDLQAETLIQAAQEAAQEAALVACWEQWRSLGALAGAYGPQEATAIVDPEALVLLSLFIRDRERRLDDFLGWWAAVGSPLLSVQRLQNLAQRLPESVQERTGAFARLAVEAGDRRWRRHQGSSNGLNLVPRKGKGVDHLSLYEAPTLMLRLRAGFGVGAKADLLTYLLGLHGARITTREATEALGYTDVALRRAAQEMILARFIEEIPGRPAHYAADPAAWKPLLQSETRGDARQPQWRHWAGIFAFLTGVLAWTDQGKEAEWSPYVWASRARDLGERHRHALDAIRLRLPEADRHRGPAYLSAFVDTVEELAEWVKIHV